MKHITKEILFLCLSGAFTPLPAQEIVSAAGGDGSVNNVNISWTIGELATETYSSANAILTQGEQQPQVNITAIKQLKDITYNIEAFPNPADEVVKLIIESGHESNMTCILIDISGKILENKIVCGKTTEIQLKKLQPSTYFLKVYKNNMELKTFKIIKK